jgi:hypothetical protein
MQTLNTAAVPESGNLYFLDSRVRTALMSGYAIGSALPIAATDTLVEALAKLEGSIAAVQAGGQWTTANGNVYRTSGNVGIGTTTPFSPLEVFKNGTNDPIARFGSMGTADSQILTVRNGSGNFGVGVAGSSNAFTPGSIAGDAILRNEGGKSFLFTNGGSRTDMIINGTGNVGIGTTELNTYGGSSNWRYISVSGGSDAGIFRGISSASAYRSALVAIDGVTTASTQTDRRAGNISIELDGSASGSSNPGLIAFRTAGAVGGLADRMRIDSSGNVGIGTTTPGSSTRLNVNGQIRSASGSTTSDAIDWVSGNSMMTSFDCGSSISFANLRDGGAYTLAVTGTGTTMCSFSTTTTGDDAATVTYRFMPANAVRTASSHTLYSLQRIGTVVYVSWITGF